MSPDYHPTSDALIDFAEGDLPPEQVREIEEHLAGCETCRAYLESLERTFTLLEGDLIPEPPEAFFAFLAGRARQQARSDRRGMIFRFAPGLAAAVASVLLMWWLAGLSVSTVDGIDIIMAEMTTGEIVETASSDPGVGSLIIEASRNDLDEIDDYLQGSESIYDLLDSMSEEEQSRFMAYLKESMARGGETSGLVTGSVRKEC
jgi:hypothetical protein